MPNSWSYIPEAPAAAEQARRTMPAVPPAPALPSAPSPAPAQRPPVAAPEFPVRRPVRTLADLIVPGPVGERLRNALRQVQYHDVLFQQWNLRRIDPHRAGVALNLYGPPGTGKTMAAEALAAHLGKGFIDVNYAEIESRYVGDTPKNIVRCFEAAEKAGAVLVFNEADSILGSRLSSVTQSADHSVNLTRSVMLNQLDAFTGVVVFTTNFAANYDSAFVRRILAHVHFDLPDRETLARLWATLLPDELPRADDVDADVLAAASTGLAGGDLVNVIVAAAARAVERTGASRRVTADDLFAELVTVRAAQAAVGRPSARQELLVEQVEVPTD
ncbi:ATP-binding protein [Actinoplanes sp. GCM10030250]|uniref:ATP-binding protein n=1 Tax=Actinoplanes sp. GCM10030250 TaxID=3273376 RepID=UPI00361C28D3